MEELKKQAEALPEKMKEDAMVIYGLQQKIYAICDILLMEVVPADEVELLHFIHLAIRSMPQPYREKLFHETCVLLEAIRRERYMELKYLKGEYESGKGQIAGDFK